MSETCKQNARMEFSSWIHVREWELHLRYLTLVDNRQQNITSNRTVSNPYFVQDWSSPEAGYKAEGSSELRILSWTFLSVTSWNVLLLLSGIFVIKDFVLLVPRHLGRMKNIFNSHRVLHDYHLDEWNTKNLQKNS